MATRYEIEQVNANERLFKSFAAEFKAKEDKDGSLLIEGWASTRAVDSYDDIVEPTAFSNTIKRFLDDRPLLLWMHGWDSVPIGKILDAKIKDDGLWVEAKVLTTGEGEDIITLIKEGVLKSFSIGFRMLKWKYDEDTKIRTITELDLYEISVVNVPANPFAVFSVAQSKNIQLKSLTFPPAPGQKGKGSMTLEQLEALRKAEALTKEFQPAISTVSTEISELKKNQDKLQSLIVQLQNQAGEAAKGRMTQDELTKFSERIGADILKLQDRVDKGLAGKKVADAQIAYKDWRALANDSVYIYKDNGSPESPLMQKAWKYFNVPVKYEGDGEILKVARDLHDAVFVTASYFRYTEAQKGRGFNINMLKSAPILRQVMSAIDPEFAKAMYSTGTGLGDEWVPTEYSAQFEDLLRLEPTLQQYFQVWDMPSNPAIWPIKTGGAVVYKVGEPTVNNPNELPKTAFATGNITFTATGLGAALPVSKELIEDSIIAIVPEINKELAYAIANEFDNALINGDSTATHRDTNTSADSYTTAFDGLREIAEDDSKQFDTASTSAGVGDGTAAFAADDVRYLRKLMGIAGLDVKNVVYVASPSTYYKLLSLSPVTKANEFGATSTWLSGTLPVLDGCQIYVSANVREDLNASGVFDNSTTTKTVIIGVNTRGFRIGQRRATTLEFETNIRTQQLTFVATARRDFRKVWPSTRYPVAVGYNLAN